MEFKYTDDQIALRRAVREWAQSYLAPKAEEIDVNNRFPTETIVALGEQDLMGLAYPEELGGAGYDAISEAIAMEEISAGPALPPAPSSPDTIWALTRCIWRAMPSRKQSGCDPRWKAQNTPRSASPSLRAGLI